MIATRLFLLWVYSLFFEVKHIKPLFFPPHRWQRNLLPTVLAQCWKGKEIIFLFPIL
jgi:hypothetical protein